LNICNFKKKAADLLPVMPPLMFSNAANDKIMHSTLSTQTPNQKTVQLLLGCLGILAIAAGLGRVSACPR
jgi:hypothetical protein